MCVSMDTEKANDKKILRVCLGIQKRNHQFSQIFLAEVGLAKVMRTGCKRVIRSRLTVGHFVIDTTSEK